MNLPEVPHLLVVRQKGVVLVETSNVKLSIDPNSSGCLHQWYLPPVTIPVYPHTRIYLEPAGHRLQTAHAIGSQAEYATQIGK